MIKAILFDWGNTLMLDYPDEKGPMINWSKLSLTENADKSLSVLSNDYKCYLATNARDSNIREIQMALDAVNIGKYISYIFCYDEIRFLKPSPEYFNYIKSYLKMNNDEMLFIGDDLEKDYYGPRQFGLRSILYDPKNVINDDKIIKTDNLLKIRSMIVPRVIKKGLDDPDPEVAKAAKQILK